MIRQSSLQRSFSRYVHSTRTSIFPLPVHPPRTCRLLSRLPTPVQPESHWHHSPHYTTEHRAVASIAQAGSTFSPCVCLFHNLFFDLTLGSLLAVQVQRDSLPATSTKLPSIKHTSPVISSHLHQKPPLSNVNHPYESNRKGVAENKGIDVHAFIVRLLLLSLPRLAHPFTFLSSLSSLVGWVWVWWTLVFTTNYPALFLPPSPWSHATTFHWQPCGPSIIHFDPPSQLFSKAFSQVTTTWKFKAGKLHLAIVRALALIPPSPHVTNHTC